MPRYSSMYQEKVGRPPGTLVHMGSKKGEKSIITLIEYDGKSFAEKVMDSVEACFPLTDLPVVTWINIDGVHQTAIIEKLGELLDIHPLVQADIVNTRHRPKLEDYKDYLFVVLKNIVNGQKGKAIDDEQVSIILGTRYVVTFLETGGDLFDPVRDRLRQSSGRIRKNGADYLAYALMDIIVDRYYVILEEIGEHIDVLESELLHHPNQTTLHKIHGMKRDMIFLRRVVWPLREIMNVLERGESKLIKDNTRVYLRDIYDHIVQVMDSVETSRDMLAGMLDIYLSSVSNRLNAVMKVLTIIATIFMPLTFIAGVYGMNFHNMPEISWRYGYLSVMIFMALVGIFMILYFKKKKWL